MLFKIVYCRNVNHVLGQSLGKPLFVFSWLLVMTRKDADFT